MISKRHAKELVLKLIEETSRLDFEKACKGAHPQKIVEASIHDHERACKGARPPN